MFSEMYQIKKVLENYHKQYPKSNAIKDFFKLDSKVLMPSFPPKSHLTRGATGGLKEQIWLTDPDKKTKTCNFQFDGVREKLTLEQYRDFALTCIRPDYFVSPSEQILE